MRKKLNLHHQSIAKLALFNDFSEVTMNKIILDEKIWNSLKEPCFAGDGLDASEFQINRALLFG